MQGDRIAFVNRKINELISNLRQDPYALETTYISIASFDMEMQICLPLTELESVDLPKLEAKPSTPSMLGNTLFSLDSIFEKTIKKPTAEKKGGYPPVLFILTGGKPSDSAFAHDAMEQMLSKRKMKLCLGLTSSNLVPFYENLFAFNVEAGDIVITDLNVTNKQYWIDIFKFVEDPVSDSPRTSTLLPPPPEKIHISF